MPGKARYIQAAPSLKMQSHLLSLISRMQSFPGTGISILLFDADTVVLTPPPSPPPNVLGALMFRNSSRKGVEEGEKLFTQHQLLQRYSDTGIIEREHPVLVRADTVQRRALPSE